MSLQAVCKLFADSSKPLTQQEAAMSLLKLTKTQCTKLAEQQPHSLTRAVRARVMMEANRAIGWTKRLSR